VRGDFILQGFEDYSRQKSSTHRSRENSVVEPFGGILPPPSTFIFYIFTSLSLFYILLIKAPQLARKKVPKGRV
jgi:hypothetical protein